jgi:hypothetical protein
MYQSARAENTRLVKGIEAQSTAALALESRTFKKDGKETEKEILSAQKDNNALLQKMYDSFMGVFNGLKDTVSPL